MPEVNSVVITSPPTPQDAPKPAGKPCPEGVPTKFWNAEKGEVDVVAMSKSYTELEQKQSGKPPEAKPGEPQPKPQEIKPAEGQQPPAPIPGVSAEQMTGYTAEMTKDGKLSDASYESLAKAGYPKDVVDAYINGVQSQATQVAAQDVADIKGVAGGDEAYTEMVTWAATAMSAEDVKAYNDAVNSGDKAKAMVAVSGLKAKFIAEHGAAPSLVKGSQGPGPVDVFRSTAELTRAMSDPKYKTDPAYRQEVADKLGRSSIM